MGQIGFTLDACSKGNPVFGFSITRWTEGDLWLAKTAMKMSKNKVASMGANKALIDAVEGSFTTLKDIKFDVAVADAPDFTLTVFQDFNFTYRFDPKKSAELKRFELASRIASCSNDMGDQVALALFEAIEAYKIHYVSQSLWKEQNNFLNVFIYL